MQLGLSWGSLTAIYQCPQLNATWDRLSMMMIMMPLPIRDRRLPDTRSTWAAIASIFICICICICICDWTASQIPAPAGFVVSKFQMKSNQSCSSEIVIWNAFERGNLQFYAFYTRCLTLFNYVSMAGVSARYIFKQQNLEFVVIWYRITCGKYLLAWHFDCVMRSLKTQV